MRVRTTIVLAVKLFLTLPEQSVVRVRASPNSWCRYPQAVIAGGWLWIRNSGGLKMIVPREWPGNVLPDGGIAEIRGDLEITGTA